MNVITMILIGTNLASFLFIIVLALFTIQLKKQLKLSKQRQESYEVKDLLQDILSGKGLVEVRRISPIDVFLRSPRDQ